jgi:hypothetical protein
MTRGTRDRSANHHPIDDFVGDEYAMCLFVMAYRTGKMLGQFDEHR